jgi:hypothetical protein
MLLKLIINSSLNIIERILILKIINTISNLNIILIKKDNNKIILFII